MLCGSEETGKTPRITILSKVRPGKRSRLIPPQSSERFRCRVPPLLPTIGIVLFRRILRFFDIFGFGSVDDICRIINRNELAVQISGGRGFTAQNYPSDLLTALPFFYQDLLLRGGQSLSEEERLMPTLEI